MNLPPSNLNVRNWQKGHQLDTTNKFENELQNQLKTNKKLIDELLKHLVT